MNTIKFKDSEKDALMWLFWKGMEITKSNKKYDIFDRLYQEISNTKSERNKSTETSDKHDSEQLNILGVIGRLSADDLEIFHYSIRIPKLTEKIISEKMCEKIDNELSNRISGIDYVNVEENGILVVGFRNMILTNKQIQTVVDVLNDL